MQTRNIRITIEYDGSQYCGWQTQPKRMSIQTVLENAIKKIVNEPVKLYAAGRTDARVHAQAQVANFKTDSSIPLKNIVAALNSLLPQDIVVKEAKEVAALFHARRDAKWRIYQYRILNRKIPSAFQHNYTYFYPYQLNLSKMRKAAKYLIGTHDFTAFNASPVRNLVNIAPETGNNNLNISNGASPKVVLHSLRTIHTLSIHRENEVILITIQANAYLHNMVRIIVGTLIEVGRGKLEPGQMQDILKSKQRTKAGMTVPPQGLFLMQVRY